MINLKDINKNTLINKADAVNVLLDIPNYHRSSDHQECVDIAQKSQKITTALYMVTELNKDNDPLLLLMRKTSVNIMESLFVVVSLKDGERVASLSNTVVLLSSLVSYLDIIKKNGKISVMNYQLLISEIQKIHERIGILITKTMPYDRKNNVSQVVDEFTFSESFFETESSLQKDKPTQTHLVVKKPETIKDIKKDSKGHGDKVNTYKDVNREVSSKGHTKSIKISTLNNKPQNKVKTSDAKTLRHENILKILKQKKNAKIGDVAALIKDCSSKTIQRDLNELVEKSLVNKEGERRWSIYNLAY